MRAWIYCILMLLCVALHAQEDKVIVCDNGLEAVSWAIEFIEKADQSIEFCPCFCGGEMLQQIFQKIEQRMKVNPKLRVHVLMSPMFVEPEDKQLLDRLCQQYSRQFSLVYTSIVVSCCDQLTATDNHMKMLVVDETYFVVGGTNYDYNLCSEGTFTPPRQAKNCAVGPGLPSGARDQDLVGRGLIARELRQTFHKFFALWKDFNAHKRFISMDPEYYSDKSTFYEIDLRRRPSVISFEAFEEGLEVDYDKLNCVLSGPIQFPHNKISELYCQLIDEAKEEILIGNLHFAPAECILESLMRAANRGVKIKIITNGTHDQSPVCTRPVSVANILYYIPVMYGKKYSLSEQKRCEEDPLLSTEVYLYSVSDVLYHKKIMIVDGKKFIVGSYNLALRSNNSDYEIVMVVENEKVAKKAQQIYARDLQFSRPLSAQQARGWYFDFFVVYEAELQRKFNSFF